MAERDYDIPLSKLKNIGPKSETWLKEIGVRTKQDIIDFGPANICHVLKKRGYNVSLVMAYALQGAIMDLHWNTIPDEVKEQLKIDYKLGD